jgi:hypothetical protein
MRQAAQPEIYLVGARSFGSSGVPPGHDFRVVTAELALSLLHYICGRLLRAFGCEIGDCNGLGNRLQYVTAESQILKIEKDLHLIYWLRL